MVTNAGGSRSRAGRQHRDQIAEPPAHLVACLREAGIDHEFVAPGVPMPTVPLAAAAVGVAVEAILKTLLFVSPEGVCVAAIACGPDRIDRRKLAAAVGFTSVKMAPPEVVLGVTGYLAGGVAPVGHVESIPVVIDRRVMDLTEGWGGGGSERLLLRLRPADIQRLTGATVADLLVDLE